MKVVILILGQTIDDIKTETETPLSLCRLKGEQTVLAHQLRSLENYGVDNVLVAGKIEETHRATAHTARFPGICFSFAEKPAGQAMSAWLAGLLAGEQEEPVLLLREDIIFNAALVKALADHFDPVVLAVDKTAPLQEGILRVRADMSRLSKISTAIQGVGCFAFPGAFKLDKAALECWSRALKERDTDSPEEMFLALQAVLDACSAKYIAVEAMFKEDWDINTANFNRDARDTKDRPLIKQISGGEDLLRTREYLRYYDKGQIVESGRSSVLGIFKKLRRYHLSKPLVVHDETWDELPVAYLLEYYGVAHVLFPVAGKWAEEASCRRAAELFQSEGCDCVISIGSRAAVDTAKYVCCPPEEEMPQGFIHHFAAPSLAACETAATAHMVLQKEEGTMLVQHPGLLASDVALDANLSFPRGAKAKKDSFGFVRGLCARVLEATQRENAGKPLMFTTDMPLADKAKEAALQLALAGAQMLAKNRKGYLKASTNKECRVMEAFYTIGQASGLQAALQEPVFQGESSLPGLSQAGETMPALLKKMNVSML